MREEIQRGEKSARDTEGDSEAEIEENINSTYEITQKHKVIFNTTL